MALDEGLILRAKAQDPEALNEVAEYIMKRLPPFLMSKFPHLPHADTEDATMVVLEKFIKDPMSVQAQNMRSLFAWAKKVAQNLLLDQIDSPRSKTIPLYINDRDGNEMELPIVDQRVQEKILQLEQRIIVSSTLQAALNQLSQTDKYIIYEYHLEERPIEAIARDLEMKVAAVKQRKKRALDKVKEILNNQDITYNSVH